jgi:hypothetical protein
MPVASPGFPPRAPRLSRSAIDSASSVEPDTIMPTSWLRSMTDQRMTTVEAPSGSVSMSTPRP